MHSEEKHPLRAIDETLATVKKTQKILASARRFGFFDLFDGKDHGLFFSFLKRRRLKQANAQFEVLEQQLDTVREAASAHQLAVNLSAIKVSWFWDMWFDNIFADWSSQRKIKKSLKEVKKLRQQLLQLRKEIDRQR